MNHQKNEEWLKKYLKKNGYLRTLDIYEKDLKLKKSKLSFQIVFPTKKIQNSFLKCDQGQKKSKTKNQKATKKTEIPKKFRKLAITFGIPKHLHPFFFDNKDDFHWEFFNPDIHCSERTCKYTTKHSKQCLDNHMREEHGWADFPCKEDECEYVAYSKRCLAFHKTRFHGTGM